MKINLLASIFIISFLSLSSCQKALIGEEIASTPTKTFQRIWQDFDENYGLFEVKSVNWDSLYDALRPQVNDQMTDAELYDVTVALLKPLNDKHVTLFPATNPELPRWSVDLTETGSYVTEDFDFDVVKNKYLSDYRELTPFISCGWLTDEVAYLYIQHMDGNQKDYVTALDEAFKLFENAKGMVLDLREDAGGFDPISQYVAGRFSTEKKLYMTTRKKKGPGHDDFTKTQEWFVEPKGSTQFTQPVAVLTTGATASAGETLLLALRTQAHITQVGATTSGNLSDAPMWEAQNGWTYTISVGDYRDAEGNSYEGIGIAPDVEVKNKKDDLLNGKDETLEQAIELLKH